jgi:hypothetical protein
LSVLVVSPRIRGDVDVQRVRICLGADFVRGLRESCS